MIFTIEFIWNLMQNLRRCDEGHFQKYRRNKSLILYSGEESNPPECKCVDLIFAQFMHSYSREWKYITIQHFFDNHYFSSSRGFIK